MKAAKLALLSLLVASVSSMRRHHDMRNLEDMDSREEEELAHEAVLGSEDDIEEYAHLHPQEAKRKLGLIFLKMDTNQDGYLDEEELGKWILKSFIKMDAEETKAAVKPLDKDGDDMISWEEFAMDKYGMVEDMLHDYQNLHAEAPEMKDAMAKSVAYNRKKFAVADENGDGRLTYEEMTVFRNPYDYSKMAEVEIENVLTNYDANRDGKITTAEFATSETQAELPENERLGEKENFDYNDKNEDGYLDADEIREWVSEDLGHISLEEAAHLIRGTDKNKDGKLTSEEVQAEHELWVGSEATDYGQMLHDEL